MKVAPLYSQIIFLQLQGNDCVCSWVVHIQNFFHCSYKVTVMFGGYHPTYYFPGLQFVFFKTLRMVSCDIFSTCFSSIILSANILNDHLANPSGALLQLSAIKCASLSPSTLGSFAQLMEIINKGVHSSQQYRTAYVLLNCDEGKYGDKLTGKEISRVLKISMRMIDRIKERFVEQGFEACHWWMGYRYNPVAPVMSIFPLLNKRFSNFSR